MEKLNYKYPLEQRHEKEREIILQVIRSLFCRIGINNYAEHTRVFSVLNDYIGHIDTETINLANEKAELFYTICQNEASNFLNQ